MGHADQTYWTAPIDFGIAMLHVELGAAREGVRGAWERLEEPVVARFVPNETETSDRRRASARALAQTAGRTRCTGGSHTLQASLRSLLSLIAMRLLERYRQPLRW